MTIEERVERLERQNRRMKRVCLLCLTAIITGALLCALGLTLNRAHAQGTEAQKAIEASAFRLVDGQGNLRAELCTSRGSPALILYNKQGVDRAMLTLGVDGSSPMLYFNMIMSLAHHESLPGPSRRQEVVCRIALPLAVGG